jgi:YggT family protein
MGAELIPSVLGKGLGSFIQIYLVLILLRVLLTWFPTIDWGNPPFSILSQLTDPYLNLFRSLLPPLGGMDFSPILALFVLQIVAGLLGSGF